jgi:hypothetical protein
MCACVKICTRQGGFVCDLMDNVNLAQQEWFKPYNNPFTKYEDSILGYESTLFKG